jgi:hypothetical protein
MTEDERAVLWQQQVLNRIAFQTALWHSLMAPPGPRDQVLADFGPLIMYAAQEQAGWTDPEDDP